MQDVEFWDVLTGVFFFENLFSNCKLSGEKPKKQSAMLFVVLSSERLAGFKRRRLVAPA